MIALSNEIIEAKQIFTFVVVEKEMGHKRKRM